jgi:hypothetical protein
LYNGTVIHQHYARTLIAWFRGMLDEDVLERCYGHLPRSSPTTTWCAGAWTAWSFY